MEAATAFRLPSSGRRGRAAAAFVGGVLLAACGQKGPLYLPEKPGEVVTRPAPSAEPAPAETSSPQKPEDDETADPPR